VNQLVDKNFDSIKMQQHGVCVEITSYFIHLFIYLFKIYSIYDRCVFSRTCRKRMTIPENNGPSMMLFATTAISALVSSAFQLVSLTVNKLPVDTCAL
jgi:hypothetical protein